MVPVHTEYTTTAATKRLALGYILYMHMSLHIHINFIKCYNSHYTDEEISLETTLSKFTL